MSEVQRGTRERKGPAPLGFRPQGHICRVSRLGHRMTIALRRGPRICALVGETPEVFLQ